MDVVTIGICIGLERDIWCFLSGSVPQIYAVQAVHSELPHPPKNTLRFTEYIGHV